MARSRPLLRGGGLTRGLVPALALSALLGHAALAGDVAKGRQKATACQACHGMDGRSQLPEAPNLSGQVEPYLVKALHEFKDGTRKDEQMSLAAEPLSDEDIADLAAYFASIQVDVLPPG